jgi:hypothetical protein
VAVGSKGKEKKKPNYFALKAKQMSCSDQDPVVKLVAKTVAYLCPTVPFVRRS